MGKASEVKRLFRCTYGEDDHRAHIVAASAMDAYEVLVDAGEELGLDDMWPSDLWPLVVVPETEAVTVGWCASEDVPKTYADHPGVHYEEDEDEDDKWARKYLRASPDVWSEILADGEILCATLWAEYC